MISDPVHLVIVFVVVVVASTVKGALGFGFPLVAVPLLATLLGPRVAIPVIAIPTMLSNVILLSRGGIGRATGSLLLALAGTALGTIGGALLIKTLDLRLLSVLVGGVALAYVLATTFRLMAGIAPSIGQRAAPLVGVLAGLMGGATGIFGPLLASYLHLLRLPKREFVFWITLLFFVGNIVQVLSYFRLGLYGGPVLALSLAACIPMALGTVAGMLLQDRLDAVVFGRAVLATVFLAALNLFLRGVLP